MFDEQKADRAVSFVKLLRNTQGEYAKHPFNLMPFQEKIGRADRDNTIDVMDWAVAIRASSDLSISFSAISGNRER